jgi:hypothetical protein
MRVETRTAPSLPRHEEVLGARRAETSEAIMWVTDLFERAATAPRRQSNQREGGSNMRPYDQLTPRWGTAED